MTIKGEPTDTVPFQFCQSPHYVIGFPIIYQRVFNQIQYLTRKLGGFDKKSLSLKYIENSKSQVCEVVHFAAALNDNRRI